MRTPISCRSLARPVLAGTVAALLAVCGAANAASTYETFTTAAAFDGAVPGATSYGFPSGGGDDGGVEESRPYVVGPLGFSTLQHFTHPFLQDDGGYGVGVPYLAMEGDNGVNAAIQPVVDGNLYAVAFDLGTYAGADTLTLTMNFYDTVETFQTSGGVGSSTFIGIVSSDPISQISFTAQDGSEIDIIDFQVGQITAPVPEPANLSMALAGLGLVGFAARRRKAAKAAKA
jgi:hypothetical protein